MLSINDIQEEVIEEFSIFEEWMDKYEHLIELGKELPLISEKHKVADNLIKGCQSQVWLHADLQDGILNFTADSDAIITKGIIALMVRVLSGHTPDQIAHSELYFIERIGLRDHLSPTRANGLLSMVKQMKYYALAYKAKEQG